MAALGIHAAGNTYNPCLLILAVKGYGLSSEELEDGMIYSAEKGENRFSGFSPPELLGIVVLGETFGEDWNRQLPDILADVLAKSADERP